MRTITVLASAALASAIAFSGAATADDRVHLTPPLYREQARAQQQVRPQAELATTPSLVPAAPAAPAGAKLSAARILVEASTR